VTLGTIPASGSHHKVGRTRAAGDRRRNPRGDRWAHRHYVSRPAATPTRAAV